MQYLGHIYISVFYLATLALPTINIRDKASETYKGDEICNISVSSVLAEWKVVMIWHGISGGSLLGDSQLQTLFENQFQEQIFT